MSSSAMPAADYGDQQLQRELSVLLMAKPLKDLKAIARRYRVPCFSVMTKSELAYVISFAIDNALADPASAPPSKQR